MPTFCSKIVLMDLFRRIITAHQSSLTHCLSHTHTLNIYIDMQWIILIAYLEFRESRIFFLFLQLLNLLYSLTSDYNSEIKIIILIQIFNKKNFLFKSESVLFILKYTLKNILKFRLLKILILNLKSYLKKIVKPFESIFQTRPEM